MCAEPPKSQSAFCEEHTALVESLGYPSKLRPFLEKCGVNANKYTKIEREKVRMHLETLSKRAEVKTQTGSDIQGTTHLLDKDLLTPEASDVTNEEGVCPKNTGEIFRLHNWSRGILVIVSSSGIIKTWSPLYKSESPLQVALILIAYLCIALEGIPEEQFKDYFISYDNLCGLARLKLLQKPLPLEEPKDKMWLSTSHIIDALSELRNFS